MSRDTRRMSIQFFSFPSLGWWTCASPLAMTFRATERSKGHLGLVESEPPQVVSVTTVVEWRGWSVRVLQMVMMTRQVTLADVVHRC